MNGECELCGRVTVMDCGRCGGLNELTMDYVRNLLGHARAGLLSDTYPEVRNVRATVDQESNGRPNR